MDLLITRHVQFCYFWISTFPAREIPIYWGVTNLNNSCASAIAKISNIDIATALWTWCRWFLFRDSTLEGLKWVRQNFAPKNVRNQLLLMNVCACFLFGSGPCFFSVMQVNYTSTAGCFKIVTISCLVESYLLIRSLSISRCKRVYDI